jgi:ABC-type branched-subunit amino acid transport system substrate-binding protein
MAAPEPPAEVGAVVPVSGRYAVQGAQMRAGLAAWERYAGARLVMLDDRSDPELAARLHQRLAERGCRFIVGPYGSDSTRAVAKAADRTTVLWNHGAAADDVQQLPAVVSVPSPASRYLVALGTAVTRLRPGATVTLVTAAGRFARFAREGLERAAPSLGLTIAGRFSLDDPPSRITTGAVLACGPLQAELSLFRRLRGRTRALLGGVAPGIAAFPELLGEDPEGLIAPVQWHPDLGGVPALGPRTAEIAAGSPAELDYVAAQAFAVALIASRCLELDPADPLQAALALRTTTFFGAFELAPSGLQQGHRLSVVRWRSGRRELLLPAAF